MQDLASALRTRCHDNATMRAPFLDAERKTAYVSEIPVPKPAPNELRIRVKAVALNPVESLHMFNPLGRTGRVIGIDFARNIDLLGDSVPAASGSEVGFPVAGFFLRCLWCQ